MWLAFGGLEEEGGDDGRFYDCFRNPGTVVCSAATKSKSQQHPKKEEEDAR